EVDRDSVGNHRSRAKSSANFQGEVVSANGVAGQSVRIHCFEYGYRGRSGCRQQVGSLSDSGWFLLLRLVFRAIRRLLRFMGMERLALPVPLVADCLSGTAADIFPDRIGAEFSRACRSSNYLRGSVGTHLLFVALLLDGSQRDQE